MAFIIQVVGRMRRQTGVVVGLLDRVLGANLPWAAWEINRPDSGRRTAPSASNRREIKIYVAADGRYLYDAKAHPLQPVLSGDIRAMTGSQPFVRGAAAFAPQQRSAFTPPVTGDTAVVRNYV